MLPYIYVALLITFVAYHYSYFSFSSYVFSKNVNNAIFGVLSGIINLSIWILYTNSPFFGNEYLLTIIILVALFLENKLIFKVSNSYAFFIALAFTINTFSKRMILFAVFALLQPQATSFSEIIQNAEIHYIVLILSFTLSLSTISLSRKSLPRRYLDTILSDKQNMVFSTTLLTLLLALLCVFEFISNGVSSEFQSFLYLYLIVGSTALLGFMLVIIYAYHLADLRLNVESYKRISSENSQQEKLLKKLEATASTDFLTGLHSRDSADNLIEQYIQEKQKFFIVFLDMDNLKNVNDNIGHEEGDFYIKRVANIIGSEFSSELVCRYGGDEFVVIGTYDDESLIHLKTLKCYNRVIGIKQIYKKKYDTSISYGTVFVPSSNALSAKRLLAIADQRMYEAKKESKKNRKH